MDARWQTVLTDKLVDAQRLSSRLLRRGCSFHVTDIRPRLGYLISFPTAIDFERDRRLFERISYSLVPNPPE